MAPAMEMASRVVRLVEEEAMDVAWLMSERRVVDAARTVR